MQKTSHFTESSHYKNALLVGKVTTQNRGKHINSLFSKSIRHFPYTTPT